SLNLAEQFGPGDEPGGGDLLAVGRDLSAQRSAAEPHHQGGRERPGLAAEVVHRADGHPGLLQHLPAHRSLQMLTWLDETGWYRVPALGPRSGMPEQQPVIAVDDRHDHRRVGAREVLGTTMRAAAD